MERVTPDDILRVAQTYLKPEQQTIGFFEPTLADGKAAKEVAERAGCPKSRLILRANEIDWDFFHGITSLGITAGASAPEVLVEEIIDAFGQRFKVSVELVTSAQESVFFPLPRILRAEAQV